MPFVRVPPSITGWEEANELLSALYDGILTLEDARRWIDELQRESLTLLAAEIERRLPPCH